MHLCILEQGSYNLRLGCLTFIPFHLNQWLSESNYDENNSYYSILWLIFCRDEHFSDFYLAANVVSIELISEQNMERQKWLWYCNAQKLDYSGLLSYPVYDQFLMSWFLDLFS